jgi:hypothetical protein
MSLWWNGRHVSLRSLCLNKREGSTPFNDTIAEMEKWQTRMFQEHVPKGVTGSTPVLSTHFIVMFLMQKRITKDELDLIHKEARQGVHVACSKDHICTARDGCISGDRKDVIICKLCEELIETRKVIALFIKTVNPE